MTRLEYNYIIGKHDGYSFIYCDTTDTIAIWIGRHDITSSDECSLAEMFDTDYEFTGQVFDDIQLNWDDNLWYEEDATSEQVFELTKENYHLKDWLKRQEAKEDYLVIDEKNHDIFVDTFATKEDAINEAKNYWSKLSNHDRKNRVMTAGRGNKATLELSEIYEEFKN